MAFTLGNKHIITGVLGVSLLAGGAVAVLNQEAEIKLENPQYVAWDRPKTDEQWADDVKVESLDIRSDKVLKTMLETHKNKLKEEEKAFEKYRVMLSNGERPEQYLYYEWYDRLKELNPGITESELVNESKKYASEDFKQKAESIEKLKQSIERMEKEIELRRRGVVIVKGKEPIFGGVESKFIRNVVEE